VIYTVGVVVALCCRGHHCPVSFVVVVVVVTSSLSQLLLWPLLVLSQQLVRAHKHVVRKPKQCRCVGQCIEVAKQELHHARC